MEGEQARVNTVVIAEPLRSIDEYKNEVLEASRRSRAVKITSSDDAVLMAICVAQLVESTKKARKYFVDAWSTSSTSLDINQHSQQIRIFMERIQCQHPDPEDLGIVLNFADNDGDFMGDVEVAVGILNENKRVILRGINEGVFRAISVAQVLSDAGEATKKSIDISTDYRNHKAAKIEIEMAPRLDRIKFKPVSITEKELRAIVASNSWKRWQMGVSPGTSSSNSKQQLIVKNTGDVGSPGASSSGSQKSCNAPSISKRKGGVGSPQPSSSNTKKQCEFPPIDKSTGNVESTWVSSSDAEKQCKAPSIDKIKVCVKSPGVIIF